MSVTFSVTVPRSTPAYPLVSAALVDCSATPGSITGGFSGTYEIMQF